VIERWRRELAEVREFLGGPYGKTLFTLWALCIAVLTAGVVCLCCIGLLLW
jgi:hypothetical protein